MTSDLARMELKDAYCWNAQQFLVYLASSISRCSHRVVSAIYNELSSRGYRALLSFGENFSHDLHQRSEQGRQ